VRAVRAVRAVRNNNNLFNLTTQKVDHKNTPLRAIARTGCLLNRMSFFHYNTGKWL